MFPLHSPIFRRNAPRRGFSLIEVVIALGVVSFAIVPILGLVGTSLNSYRGAMHDTVARQIMSELAANAQQASINDLQRNSQSTYYFNNEGLPVENNDVSRTYTATVTRLPDSDLLNSSNLFRVSIQVVAREQSAVQKTSLRVLPQS